MCVGHRRRPGAAIACAVAAALGASAAATAAPLLDLDLSPPTGQLWVDNDADFQQHFAVGRPGRLARLDVWVDRAPDTGAGLVLQPSTGGAPLLLAAFGPGASGWTSIDLLPLALDVRAGDGFSFDLQHDDVLIVGTTSGRLAAHTLLWSCAFDCIAPSGPALPRVPGGTLLDLEPLDLAFRTWVLPEPGVWLGLLALAPGLWRSRRGPRTSLPVEPS